jgi:beta-glucanase (GH16 family)
MAAILFFGRGKVKLFSKFCPWAAPRSSASVRLRQPLFPEIVEYSMTSRFLFVCLAVVNGIFTASALAGDWKLVWSDEFDHPGLPDKSRWGYEEGFIRNGESQYYTVSRPENARVEDGMLVIEGRKENFAAATSKKPADYTSASVTTEGKASWTYGRLEVRAKLPEGKGMWPAIWTLGDNIHAIGWPKCGEIDIMEFVGKAPADIHGTIHYDKNGQHASNGGSTPIKNPSDGFHTYAVEWWPDRIDFFFDDKKYRTSPLADAGVGEENAFRKPHYLILNLALGGSWGGAIDDSRLPQKFLIDYVRVYQQK